MRFPSTVAQYLQILRAAGRDASATAKSADEARLVYLEAHAGPRRKGESRGDYETRHNLAMATAPHGGWPHAKLASDIRGRVDVVSTLQGGCFVGTTRDRIAAAAALQQVLRLDGGGLAVLAASEVGQWSGELAATPTAKPRARDTSTRDTVHLSAPFGDTAVAPPVGEKPKVNAKFNKAVAPASKVEAVAAWLSRAWA